MHTIYVQYSLNICSTMSVCTFLFFTSHSAMKVEVERNGTEFEVELDSVMVSVGAQNDTGTLRRCEVL